jgi:hypothetical protein
LRRKALEQEFARKVKCIFFGQPTGSAFTHYDHGSIWIKRRKKPDDGLFVNAGELNVEGRRTSARSIFAGRNVLEAEAFLCKLREFGRLNLLQRRSWASSSSLPRTCLTRRVVSPEFMPDSLGRATFY